MYKQEGQWNIKYEQTDMPVDRIITQAHHQTGYAGTQQTRTWLETRNMHIPNKHLQISN